MALISGAWSKPETERYDRRHFRLGVGEKNSRHFLNKIWSEHVFLSAKVLIEGSTVKSSLLRDVDAGSAHSYGKLLRCSNIKKHISILFFVSFYLTTQSFQIIPVWRWVSGIILACKSACNSSILLDSFNCIDVLFSNS